MYRLIVDLSGDDLALRVFKVLEREVNFGRGRLYVEGEMVVAEAVDATSLRSLMHTLMRALYVIHNVEGI